MALARIWLLSNGDICDTCHFHDECPDQTHCLHLVASAGNPRGRKKDYSRLVGDFRRFPLGVRKIGRVAATGEPLLLENVQANENWIVNPKWTKSQHIQSFAAQPLIYHDEILGVLGIFDRSHLSPSDFEWIRIVADHAAVSIANARAFKEISDLKERLQEENNYLRLEVSETLGSSGIVGVSPGLRNVMEKITLVAPTDASVMINGESGTGKEVVARAIHENSSRQNRPMIKVNCGAVPDTLFESEFFGHVKGSFTGAFKDKIGRFELSDGGTLFLDEVGEIPLPMQSKLLRVLQEKELERVGDTRSRKVDVRIIAATNRHLANEVKAGRFREDLYYRLSVFPITVPPLRERCEDIEPLALHFLNQVTRRMNRTSVRVTKKSIQQLCNYDWPGNVRELENAIERALILTQGGILQLELPKASTYVEIESKPNLLTDTLLTRTQLRKRERDNLTIALSRSGGKISGSGGAAELLGMKPTTLASKIKALNIVIEK